MNKEKLIEALETALAELRKPTITFTPPKREPLDLDQIDRHLEINDYSDEYRHAYCEGIIFAEKAHGIGE